MFYIYFLLELSLFWEYTEDITSHIILYAVDLKVTIEEPNDYALVNIKDVKWFSV
jgi:hypothetical protein